jgi:Cdc6-like AAA superfamily ATPase
VVDPTALEWIAKRVANCSGDARKAFEMTMNAIQLCLETTKGWVESGGPLVKIPHVLRAVKQEENCTEIIKGAVKQEKNCTEIIKGAVKQEKNYTEIIKGTPVMGKILLSIVVVLAKAKSNSINLGKLKHFVQECLNRTNRMSELLETDIFLLMMDNLIDDRMLSTGNTSGKTRLSLATVSELMQMPIQLLAPLEEAEMALKDEIEGREFYARLRDHAKVLAADN